jgi:KAP family P-loop domain
MLSVSGDQVMAQPIPIIADVPRADPGLGFAEYAEALADAIRGGQPAQFTIGIYGEWGSGKSSLLNAVAKNLSQKTDVVPVLFDAWRYERTGHIVVPLLHRIYRTTAVLGNTKVSGYLRQALMSVVYSLKFNLGVVELDMERLQKPGEGAELIPLDHAFDRPFADMSNLSNALVLPYGSSCVVRGWLVGADPARRWGR